MDNAKKCADSNAGYSVFDESGKVVYTGKQTGSGSSTGSFLVQVTATDLNIRKGPGTNYARTREVYGERCVHDYRGKIRHWFHCWMG